MQDRNRLSFFIFHVCIVADTLGVIVYRPNNYFGDQNPSSPWSFGYIQPDDHLNFILYPNYTSNVYGQLQFDNLQQQTMSGYAMWYAYTVGDGGYVSLGTVGLNTNQNAYVQLNNEFRLKPRQLTFHPGLNNAHATIRFTVPKRGYYDVKGVFFAPGFMSSRVFDATTDVHLVVNNVERASLWTTRNPGTLRLKRIFLKIGDYVQYEVRWGKNQNYNGDTTAANIEITYLN